MTPTTPIRLRRAAPLIAALAIVVVLVVVVRSRRMIRAEPLLIDDPHTLLKLERRGLSFKRVVGSARLERIAEIVERDMTELTEGRAKNDPRRPFNPDWLSRGRFELVGVVNRIDRRRFDPAACGEVRLVYRLALANPDRPATRLPMTINVRIPQPKLRGDSDCSGVAKRWLERSDVVGLVEELPPTQEIEINFQSIHVPSFRQDMDDVAEYILRSFATNGQTLEEDGLFNTPRADVDRRALLDWVSAHLDEIDDGSAVLPVSFLAKRAVSVSPRGLAREQNRPYSALLTTAELTRLPLDRLKLARTPELLLRRLDESTCVGCHQTRGVAGFHLLGEERSEKADFNALAVGHSGHFGADLGWRAIDLASASRGERSPARPFAAYPNGEAGSECGLVPGLSSWSCRAGLRCRDLHHSDVGTCALAGGSDPGDPCEDVSMSPSTRAEGPIVTAAAVDSTCPASTGAAHTGKLCAPNWLGFTGGVCSELCSDIGSRRGGAICAPLPSAGYEADCFFSNEAPESCLARHFANAFVASCDASHPCRDDYGCARIPSAPRGTGACVPPYFIFQARVDGPRVDR